MKKLDFIVNNVALVEDDLVILKETRSLLLNTGLAKYVECFTSGLQAIQYMNKNSNIDLVITDYCMADGDGGEVVDYILNKTYNEKGRHTPILVITGHREVQEIENTSKGLRVLIKPVMFENLYTEINDMIKCEEIYLLRSSIQEIQSIIEKISTILETKGD